MRLYKNNFNVYYLYKKYIISNEWAKFIVTEKI